MTKFGNKLGATTPLNIFLLNVNFDKFTIGLNFLLISFIFANFSKEKKSILMSSIKYLNFKFLWYKIIHKKKFINCIVNKI